MSSQGEPSYFDRLSAALFDGPVKCVHLHVEPGPGAAAATREQLAQALLDSMTRLHLVGGGGLNALEAQHG